MTDTEIQTLVELSAIKASENTICKFKPNFELIANKAAEKAIDKAKAEWEKEIKVHSIQCEAHKYKSFKLFVSATIGGIVVGFINWLLGR